MTIAEITQKMIDYSEGSLHDINHFLKVYAYAKTIGEMEQLDAETQKILEVAALLHDIACPLCREKYGNTAGPLQEKEGTLLAADFLKDSGFSSRFIDRVIFLIGHHHTLDQVEGSDYQILLEADYLVNADESGHSRQQIETILQTVFQTKTGRSLLQSLYLK